MRQSSTKICRINKVTVILESNFGERLAAMPPGIPVWIIDTPTNTPIAHRLWKERQNVDHLTGITTFRADPKNSTEANFIQELSTIDLHHGPFSSDQPYMQIEVLGTSLTGTVRDALAEYGFDEFQEILGGFEATRHHVPPTL